jgi:hypothetical protein
MSKFMMFYVMPRSANDVMTLLTIWKTKYFDEQIHVLARCGK